jgi:RNA polymerase sigma factor (sigma-70 family)
MPDAGIGRVMTRFQAGGPRASRPALDDLGLWELTVAGDHEAFGLLFERHSKAIYNYCFRRIGDWTAAEDLMSATFLTAWRRRREVGITGTSLLPWLYGIATNLLLRDVRSRIRRRAALITLPEPEDEPDPADDVAGRLDDARTVRELLDAIAFLPSSSQDVLALCVWQGLSYEEAARALELPIGTVRSRLSRAKARLRRRSLELERSIGDERVDDRAATGEKECR